MHYSKVSRHGSRTRHPAKMKIVMGLVKVMEGRPRLRPGGYTGLAASSRPHSRIYFGHAEAWPSTGIAIRSRAGGMGKNDQGLGMNDDLLEGRPRLRPGG